MSDAAPKLNPYQRLVTQAFEHSVPLTCQMEITYRCNHLCTFCYNAPSGAREMTTDQIFQVLGKVAEFGVLYVTLTGGEALCHKDFFKIAHEVRRLGMAVRIYSNGFLLGDKRVVRKIKELIPMDVEISIHGARPETHDALTRIRGSFERTIQGVKNLTEAGIKVTLKCPITNLNQHELFEIKKLARELGHHITFDAVITPKDDGNRDPLALRADNDFLDKYWGEWYAELHDGRLPPRGNHCAGDGDAICGSGRSGFTIDPYGNLLPCVAFRRVIGNVLEIDNLEEIWGSSPVLGQVRQLSVDMKKKLARHEDGEYFAGFCMGLAETQTGDPTTVYPQAQINAKAVRRHYELLQIGGSREEKSA